MKFKRYKHARKLISFYKMNYGVREPYQVLVDGTFCQAALKGKIYIKEQLPKYIGSSVQILTTRCAIEETRSIGDDLIGALLVAKRFQQRNCGHKHKCIPAADCFTSLIGNDNSNHYFVATQDVELRRKLRRIPGVPLLYINRNTIVLEGVSDTSRDQAKQIGVEKVQPTKYQQSVLDSLGSELAETTKKPKRKKIKGPNPLSCKKKSKITGPFAAKSPGIVGKGRKRRIRKCRQQAAYLLSKVPVPSSD
ncbi:rRNA-processing protein UTP23 homolog [Dysidea avara]|uniref:rRNA-processing protein UTP23 homolog n=1 Tax=Dysidea avara TaxID=196820 RepID=UPI00332CA238